MKKRCYGELKVFVSLEIELPDDTDEEDVEMEANYILEEIEPEAVIGDGACAQHLKLKGKFVPESVSFETTDCYPRLYLDE